MKITLFKRTDLREGQEITFHNTSETPTRPGDSFGIFENEQRIALGRVTEDCSKDPKYSIDVHGHGPTNSAKNILKGKIEVVYE